MSLVELDSRFNDGLLVELLWNNETNEVVLSVSDNKTDFCDFVYVPNDRAFDAFQHPYSYTKKVGETVASV